MNGLYEKENLSMFNLVKILILLCIVSSNLSSAELDVQKKLEEINQLSKDSFGISVNALMYLSEITQTSYLPFDFLEKNQKLKYILELDLNGYVKMHKVQGLPDGTQNNMEFVNIIPLLKGFDMIYKLQNMNHENSKNKQARIDEIKPISTIKPLTVLKYEAEQQLKTIEQQNKQQQQLLAKANQQLKHIENEKADLLEEEKKRLDVNNDGKQDTFYEISDTGYLYIIDRNFDGKKDECWEYDLDDRLISGVADNNFDGEYETKFIIKSGTILKQLIDTNQNGSFDVFIYYESGIAVLSEKFYPASTTETLAKIGKVTHGFGSISEKETFKTTTLTEVEFQNNRLDSI